MLGIVHKLHNYLTRLSTPSDTEMTSLTRGRLSPILLTAVTRNLYWRPGRQGTVRVLSLVWPHAHQVSFSLSIFSSWRKNYYYFHIVLEFFLLIRVYYIFAQVLSWFCMLGILFKQNLIQKEFCWVHWTFIWILIWCSA